jgi:hypothetical protein
LARIGIGIRIMQASDLVMVLGLGFSGSGNWASWGNLQYVEDGDDNVKRFTESAIVCFS